MNDNSMSFVPSPINSPLNEIANDFSRSEPIEGATNVNNSNENVQAPEDLNDFVTDLLEQMQTKFQTMGNSIIGRIDEMGNRIDDLESSIGELIDNAGLSDNPSVGNSSKRNNLERLRNEPSGVEGKS
eukprot:CAMPEP_0198259052 /NCGR_PEP_ID=MMETSP1447-20131203/8334_1 /TAXON_ID=420782 /ORGANISM="Chaetoceros dichaeta, Strain CCMP1751" /LENGTH=127 /DNA_ID=CAMNT_0043946333 /DNA_START=192 /DNA_END=575 /DNA_ORIENTATION=+